jgi:hypothetical protein
MVFSRVHTVSMWHKLIDMHEVFGVNTFVAGSDKGSGRLMLPIRTQLVLTGGFEQPAG